LEACWRSKVFWTIGEIGFLVQHDPKRAGHRAFDRRSAQLAVALRGVRIADG